MFKLFKNKDKKLRTLTHPDELEVGDIVGLKDRRSLPKELQGQQFEVTAVGSYQYASSTEREFTLRSEDSLSYYMSVDDNDGDPILGFSIKIPRDAVLKIFDEEEFAMLWEPEFPTLSVRHTPEAYASWLTDRYHQIVKSEEAYFYNRDLGDKPPSRRMDDDGEEFRYHECEGEPEDQYGLSIEVWASGETDVSLAVYTPQDVIDELWPHA